MDAVQDGATQAAAGALPGAAIPLAQRPVLVGLVAGAAVVVLDFFIVLACLPSIEQTLGATQAQLQLVMAAYAIANGSFLVLGGRLGDVLGRKRVFMGALAAFALASIGCGLATSPLALIVARALQGAAGALLQPQVLGLLAVNFKAAARPRVFGVYGAAMGLAGIVAQVVGGTMVELLPADIGWRACFFLSLPLCLFAAHFARAATEGSRAGAGRVDVIGALLLALTLGAGCAFLTIGRESGWPVPAWVTLAAALLGGVLFAGWIGIGRAFAVERIIPAGMLAADGFGLALLTILVFYSGIASLYFVLALELRGAAGFSPIQAGLLFGWLGLCFAVASYVRRLKPSAGPRWAAAGMAMLFGGHIALALATTHLAGLPRVVGFLLSCSLQGLGIGSLMAPLVSMALSKVANDRVSIGGGMVAATQQVGNSLGICLIGFAYFGGALSGAPAAPRPAMAVIYLIAMQGLLALLIVKAARRR